MQHVIDQAALEALPPEQRRQALSLLRHHLDAHKRNPLWRFDPLDPNGTGIPHVKQDRWMAATRADRRLFIGGNRSGKTTAGVLADIIDCCDREVIPPHLERYKRWEAPVQMFVVGVNNRAIQTVQLPKFREWCPRDQLIGNNFDRAFDKELQRLSFKNGSWIQFMTQQMEVSAFAGASLHRVHFDEEPVYDHGLAIYGECMSRLIDHGGDVLVTMTPVDGMTWLYDRLYLPWENQVGPSVNDGFAQFVVDVDLDIRSNVFVAKVDMDDNPTLDARGKAIVLSEFTNEDERTARKKGLFVSFSGKVYDQFDKAVHVIPEEEALRHLEPAMLQRLAVGLDPGFRHMAAAVWVARTERHIIVASELPMRETIISQVAKGILMRNMALGVTPNLYPADPAILKRDGQTGKTDQMAFMEAGVPAFPGMNDVRPGINIIKGLLECREVGEDGEGRDPTLLISASCTALIEEFNRYRWVQPKRTEHAPREQPVKRDDHLLDALRYAVMALPRPERVVAPDTRSRVERMIDEETKALERSREQQDEQYVA